MNTINSAIALVKSPASYITSNKDTPATVNGIMVNYVAVLAAIPFLATLIGYLWYYDLFIPRGFVGSFVAYAFVYAFLFYILDVIAVYVVALAIGFLAPTFGSSTDKIKSLKLSAFIFTPAFLIGVLNIIPFLGILEFLGILYGLYILYLGLPILMGTPKDKVVTYVVAIVIATFIVYFVLDAIVGVATAAAFHVGMGLI
jgi:Yip1 domain